MGREIVAWPWYDYISETMIYTDFEGKSLASRAVEKAEDKAIETGQPLSEEEKERLWKLIRMAAETGS